VLISWKNSREGHQVLKEIHSRVDELAQDLANGTLLAHTADHMIAREYSRIRGEIQGLLYIEKLIEDYKEEQQNEVI